MKPADVDVLIAGGGLAAQRCCEALRRGGFDGGITVLCEEPSAPYDRPPLSKAVLTDATEPQQPLLRAGGWYEEHAVQLMLGTAAWRLDPAARTVALRDTRTGRDAGGLHYRRLVIATGSHPCQLPGLARGGIVHELRTYADARALRHALHEREGRIAVLGAGLVGMEVAASACALGREVTMIEASATPLARALPPALGRWIAALHQQHGVDVRLATTLQRASLRRGSARLELSDGTTIAVDTVLVAAGTRPATDWLTDCGLRPGPIATDASGRTAVPDVYAAGDAACYPEPFLGERVASQHWEAAARQGSIVARAIMRQKPLPPVAPMFWSDQYGRRIQLVGHAPPGGEIEIDGDRGGSFTAWITHHRRAAAALLVNRPDVVPRARRWLADSLQGNAGSANAAGRDSQLEMGVSPMAGPTPNGGTEWVVDR